MRPTWHIAGAVAMAIAGASGAVLGQPNSDDIGRAEYISNCAICHGEDGKGNGRLFATGFLARKPSDMTMLAANNGGVFPVQRVYMMIDGREAIAAHGPRDMPVWGTEYVAEGRRGMPELINPASYARARILALIDYLARIQAPR
jgi:mono/diheme cytochrome c family protein